MFSLGNHCPTMDMKKLKKRGNLKNCEFKNGNRDPEKVTKQGKAGCWPVSKNQSLCRIL